MYKRLQFVENGKSLTLDVPHLPMLKGELERAPHHFSYQGTPPRDWRAQYYQMFLQHKAESGPMEQVLKGLSALQPQPTEPDELVERLVAFVQGAISYDWETFRDLDQSRIRYPYETLYDETGVCADKSMLLARLLHMAGYGVGLFTFQRANHMAVALRVPAGYGDYGTSYAFVESTETTPIGHVPETYVGGIRLDRQAGLELPFGEGGRSYDKIVARKAEQAAQTAQYGKDYLRMPAAKQTLHREMTALQAELDALKPQLRGCRGTLPQAEYQRCQQLQQQHNALVERYNALVAQFNAD